MNNVQKNDITHCEEVDKTKALRDHFSMKYGINVRSPLLNVVEFDMVKQTPQDIMHVFWKVLLNSTLWQFNQVLLCYNFGYSEKRSKSEKHSLQCI